MAEPASSPLCTTSDGLPDTSVGQRHCHTTAAPLGPPIRARTYPKRSPTLPPPIIQQSPALDPEGGGIPGDLHSRAAGVPPHLPPACYRSMYFAMVWSCILVVPS